MSLRVYYTDITNMTDEAFRDILESLSMYRKAKAKKLRFPKDQMLSAAAGALLDKALDECFGIRERDCDYVANPHGKPAILGRSDISFSISHSGVVAAVAVAYGMELGLDVQQERAYNEAIAKRLYSQADLLRLANESNPTHLFNVIWTRREAYAKLTGKGLDFADDKQRLVLNDTAMRAENIYYKDEIIKRDDSYYMSLCASESLVDNVEFTFVEL